MCVLVCLILWSNNAPFKKKEVEKKRKKEKKKREKEKKGKRKKKGKKKEFFWKAFVVYADAIIYHHTPKVVLRSVLSSLYLNQVNYTILGTKCTPTYI